MRRVPVFRGGGLLGVSGSLQDVFYFGHGNHGHRFGKHEEGREEESDGADVKTNFVRRGGIVAPARRQVVAVQGSNDDHKTLEPHPDVHDDGHEEGEGYVLAQLLHPEELRADHVARHHAPVAPVVGAHGAVGEGVLLVEVAAVPGNEQLGEVGATHDGAGGHDDLVHGVDVLNGDVLLEVQHLTGDDEEGEHHGEAGEHGASHEVGREDGGMPAGNHRGGEVEGYNGVHREYERGRDSGEYERQGFMTLPVLGRAHPAEGQDGVNLLRQLLFGAVADGGDVRDQPRIPEQ